MPFLARITNTFFVTLINRLGVRPPPPEGFELSNVVQPVSIVDSDIAIASVATTPLLGTPGTIGQSAAPADTTVLADSGALAAGNWDARVVIDSDDNITTGEFCLIQRRNAADAANIWSQLVWCGGHGRVDFSFRTALALNERIRVVKQGNAAPGTVYQASVWTTLST